MQIGQLRHRIIIEEQVQVSDGMGGFTTTYSTVATVWAAIWPVSAKEIVSSAKIELNVSHKIRIRHYAGLDSSMRVNFDSRYFDIKSIINFEEREIYLDLLCLESV